MRIQFLTSTPRSVLRGSGTFVGIETLAKGLRSLGCTVDVISPTVHLPVFTAKRVLFNEMLRLQGLPACDIRVGFDMDGYAVTGKGGVPHVACLKGVIADESRVECGVTRATMAIQAQYEARHVRRADKVITHSKYSAGRVVEFYHVAPPCVIPELLDLTAWDGLLRSAGGQPDPSGFTVLCVCRLWRRKRVDVILAAAAEARRRIAGLQVRIVGQGPEAGKLRRIWRNLRLEEVVHWVGDVSRSQLAAEYGGADAFCLASVQEGFGIVFLEAMAAGKPVLAARAAAAPEVVPHAQLVEPDNAQALAEGLETLYRDPGLRRNMCAEGREIVRQYDAPRVAGLFLAAIEKLVH